MTSCKGMPTHRKARAMPVGRILVAAVVAVTLAGCTYVAPSAGSEVRSTEASVSIPFPTPTPTSVAGSWAAPLSGQFVSQAVRTTGSVRITGTATEATLTLEGVSVASDQDLKVVLNEGALSKDPSGNMVVDDPKVMDIGANLKPGGGSQSFQLPPVPAFKIRSVTIVGWQNQVAYGTADLMPTSR